MTAIYLPPEPCPATIPAGPPPAAGAWEQSLTHYPEARSQRYGWRVTRIAVSPTRNVKSDGAC
jgi:hypothetical protein